MKVAIPILVWKIRKKTWYSGKMNLQKKQGLALEDLRLVAAIGEAGSLTGAAKRLGVDHSTAFRRLGAVEARLGLRLFERARNGYAPTPGGEEAIASAGRILGELAALERRLAGRDLRPSGVVRVTTTDTLVELLTPLLAAFRAAHPGITVELATSNLFFTLTRRDADVAIRPAPSAPEDLVARRIAGIAFAPFAAPAYLAAREAGDLEALDWLGPDDTLAHLGLARWLKARVPAARVVYRASSLLALREAARAGLGVAPLPCYLAGADPGLRQLGAPQPGMASTLWLITHPDLRRSARVRAFLDFMGARLLALKDRLEAGAARV